VTVNFVSNSNSANRNTSGEEDKSL